MNQGALLILTIASRIGPFIGDSVTGFALSPKDDELDETLISALKSVRGNNKIMKGNGTALGYHTSAGAACQ